MKRQLKGNPKTRVQMLARRTNITKAGDNLAHSAITTTLHAGHQYARGMDADLHGDVRSRHEQAVAP